MSITVGPDPDHPHGGFALLSVPGTESKGPVSLSLVDLFADRHLGPMGWQSAPVALGPYDTWNAGGALMVRVGPEIVDHIEAFTPLRLTVGDASSELSWPDAVRTSPRRADLGGIGVSSDRQPVSPPSPLTQTVPERPVPEQTVPERPAPPVEERVPEPAPEPKPELEAEPVETKKPRTSMWAFVLPVLLVAVAAAAWLMIGPEDKGKPAIVDVAQPPQPVSPVAAGSPPQSQSSRCDLAKLARAAAMTAAEGFAIAAACGAEGDAEQRFKAIDAAANAGVAEAIAMLGRWWDPAEAAAVGSTYSKRDPSQAARYYHAAVAAGYAPAGALLQRACGALNPNADPMHENARDLYCR